MFTAAGFDQHGALHAARLFTGFLYGHVLHELQERVDNPDETDDLLRLGLHRLPITQFPRMRSLAGELADLRRRRRTRRRTGHRRRRTAQPTAQPRLTDRVPVGPTKVTVRVGTHPIGVTSGCCSNSRPWGRCRRCPRPRHREKS